MRLRTKFSLYTLAVVWGISGTLFAAFCWVYQSALATNLESSRLRLAMTWKSVCREAVSGKNFNFMQRHAELLVSERHVDYAYFFDAGGTIRAHSFSRFVGRPHKDWDGKLELAAGEYSSPVWVKNKQVGRAVLGFASSSAGKNEDILIPMFLLAILAGALGAVSVAVTALTADSLTDKFGRLQASAREIERGNFSVRLPETGEAEFVQIASSFNHMAEKLGELDRMKEEIIHTVSHELKTPLSAMIMYAEFLMSTEPDREKLTPRQREVLKTLIDSGFRMAMYVSNILDAAKIKSGQMKFSREATRLDLPILTTLELYSILARKKKISLSSRIAENLPVIQADPAHLQQVVSNLVSNALKYTPSGGSVVVEAAREGAGVSLAVADSGRGIPESVLSRLFEPFVPSTGEGREGGRMLAGSGLGLYIVKESVTAMGGTVSVDSNDKGTKFTLHFPSAPKA